MTPDVVAVEDVDPSRVRAVVQAAFGRPRAAASWAWKHHDGPWGPTTGAAAVERGRVIAVRLLLPWALRYDGRVVVVRRAVDAATVPEAHGRGLFSLLNQRLMDDLRSSAGWTALFSTPNGNSRGVYRRLGWRWLPPIGHRYLVVVPLTRAARWAEAADPAELVPAPGPPHLVGTDWTAEAWRWRMDPRCGSTYRGARLPDADAGLVYRAGRRNRMPFLTVLHLWGRSAQRASLLRWVARNERAPVALHALGPVSVGLGGPGHRRGESLLAVWGSEPADHVPALPIYDPNRWWMPLVDLERVL